MTHTTPSLVTPTVAAFPLTQAQPGDRLQIITLSNSAASARLLGMGLRPGATLEVMSCSGHGSLMVALGGDRFGLGADMAAHLQVIRLDDTELPPPFLTYSSSAMTSSADSLGCKLRDADMGAILKVTGYDPTARDYKRKLLAMGLTPGTTLTVTRHAPLGDPMEIEVRGFRLSLRKAEADALQVEPV